MPDFPDLAILPRVGLGTMILRRILQIPLGLESGHWTVGYLKPRSIYIFPAFLGVPKPRFLDGEQK